jgi:hypothetical protein
MNFMHIVQRTPIIFTPTWARSWSGVKCHVGVLTNFFPTLLYWMGSLYKAVSELNRRIWYRRAWRNDSHGHSKRVDTSDRLSAVTSRFDWTKNWPVISNRSHFKFRGFPFKTYRILLLIAATRSQKRAYHLQVLHVWCSQRTGFWLGLLKWTHATTRGTMK